VAAEEEIAIALRAVVVEEGDDRWIGGWIAMGVERSWVYICGRRGGIF
jgi:hypothetical protein